MNKAVCEMLGSDVIKHYCSIELHLSSSVGEEREGVKGRKCGVKANLVSQIWDNKTGRSKPWFCWISHTSRNLPVAGRSGESVSLGPDGSKAANSRSAFLHDRRR